MHTIAPAIRRHSPLLWQYRLHTHLFDNVIEGISAEDALRRITPETNHVAWLAGSLVSFRYEMANALGIPQKEAFIELYGNNRPIDDNLQYPSLLSLQDDWHYISPLLLDTVSAIPPPELANRPSPFEEMKDNSLAEVLTFIIDRESYVIGQIGILRKILGYAAMKYPAHF
jgi:hypothetical protein